MYRLIPVLSDSHCLFIKQGQYFIDSQMVNLFKIVYVSPCPCFRFLFPISLLPTSCSQQQQLSPLQILSDDEFSRLTHACIDAMPPHGV